MFSDEVQGCKDMLFFNFMQDSTEIVRRNSLKEEQGTLRQWTQRWLYFILHCKFHLHGQSLVSQLFYISKFSWDLRQ
jgi:hypothetical protein